MCLRSAAHPADMLDCLKSSGHDDPWISEFSWNVRGEPARNLGNYLEISCGKTHLDGKTKIRRAELVQHLQAQGYDEEQVENMLKRLSWRGYREMHCWKVF
jgi:hypothetical protein